MSVRDSGDKDGSRGVQAGDVVGYRYLIKDEEGHVLAASTELVYCVQGDNSPPLRIDEIMAGRVRGETFTTRLSAGEAFGSTGTLRQVTVPQDRFSRAFALPPGTCIDLRVPDGDELAVRIDDSDSRTVTLGVEHPFAGRSILFEVTVISIRIATIDELRDRSTSQAVASDVDPDLEAELLELRTQLETQFAEERASGGVSPANTSSGRHAELSMMLEAIITQVRADGDAFDHRPALSQLLRQLARYEDAATSPTAPLTRDVGGEG